jgi:hypothetical protein
VNVLAQCEWTAGTASAKCINALPLLAAGIPAGRLRSGW